MIEKKIYDKVSWHFPEGNNCPNLNAAKHHFNVIMDWLNKNQFLTEEGKEALKIGVDSDFSLTSDMINEKGNDLLSATYQDWLNSIGYSCETDTAVLDEHKSKFVS